jgi:amino acid transporter
MKLPRSLGLFDLIMFNIVAIPGLRWIAIAAAAGYNSIFLWTMAFLIFFVPQALAVIELSTRYPEEGGLYVWTKKSFSDFHGFLSGWCYWSNNLIYYPSLLIYIAGISVYALSAPHLENNKLYMSIFTVCALWFVLILNLIGMKIGKWVQNLGSLGLWIPIAVLIILAVVSVVYFGTANEFSIDKIFPNFTDYKTLAFFAALCFGFAGLELAPIMGGEIRDPRKNIPKASIISGIVVTLIYLAGTISLLLTLPEKDINIITGVMQAISKVCSKIGLPVASNVVAFLILLGGLGGAGAWLIGTARILFVAGLDRYMPPALGKVHPSWKTPYLAILIQGILSTVFIIMSFAGSTVQEAYMILLDMVIVIYFIPYLYIFASLIALRRKGIEAKKAILIPGGKAGAYITAITGFIATTIAIITALIPSEAVKVIWIYEIKVLGGCLGFILVGAFIYQLSKRRM